MYGIKQETVLYQSQETIEVIMESANMHCQGSAYTRSFDVGLKSAEGKKLEHLKFAASTI
jgi:hypothetical protein